jgi:mono/diheme cytochrome c family protein
MKLETIIFGQGNQALLRKSCLLLGACCLLVFSGCRRDMQNQPKMKPYRTTTFFGDGLSARPPVEGTIPRGFLRSDIEFFTGKKKGSQGSSAPTGQTPAGPKPTAAGMTNPYPDDIDYFPIPINDDVVARGRQRYEIFCSVCHGLTGRGDGMVVRRGYRRAASFHDDRLRQAPAGHFFDAITNGWGVMPSYAPQITVQDRWAIIAYIRALQLSQLNPQMQAAPIATSSPTPTSATGGPR